MMKVIICFGKIRVVVPCKNIHMTVGELQDKACSRYKTIIKKGSDYNVKVQNLAFASDGGILNENDEIDDVIEDKDKLIAIYEEPEDEPFEGTLKKFLSDFQEIKIEISMEDKYEDSSSDRSSIRQRQHQQQSYNNANDDVDDVITDTSQDMWNENFRRDYRYQSFGKGKIQQMQQQQEQQQTSGQQQQQQFNRLNPAHLYHNNNNNNMTSLLPADDVVTNTSHRSTPPPQPPVRSSSHHHQPPPQSPLPWFYRKSRHVRIDTRERLPLGLNLTRYDDPLSGNFCGLRVQSMEEDMRNCNCDVSRLFTCGDVIVEINGRILTNYSYEKACRLLEDGESGTEINIRLLPVETSNISFDQHDDDDDEEEEVVELQPVTNELKVEYFPLNSTTAFSSSQISPHTQSSTTSSLMTSSSGQQQQQQEEQSTSAILNNVSTYSRKIGKMSKIQLQKDSSGLGFSVTSRDTKVGDVISPIYIKNILSRGAAVKDGRLRIGDRILEINGKETNNFDQRQVVDILRNIPVGSRVDLLISRQHDFIPRQMKQNEVESLNSSVEKSTSKENYQFDIQLNDTGSAGLGISVKGNQNRKTGKGQGIFIKSIFHGGAVWQDGRLSVNDQLIEVNGNSLLGISNEEALNILRTCMLIEGSGMIQVVITRRKTSGNSNRSSNSKSATNTTTVTSSYSSGSDVTMGSDATVDDEVENFNRDSIARQSISEKRKNPNFNKYIQTTPSNGGSRRRFELKIPEEKQLKKSNSLESVNGPSINMFYQPKDSGKISKNFSSSMDDLLNDESPSSHHHPLYNTMTKTRPLNNSFRAALDSSSVSSKSSDVSKNSKFFTFKKPKHLKRENENKKIPTTPYKENHHHHHQRRATPSITSSPVKSARSNLNHKLQSCVEAVTSHHRKSYDVTTPPTTNNNSYHDDHHDDVTTTTPTTMRSSRSKRSLHRSSPSPRSKSVVSVRNNQQQQQQTTTTETNNKPRYRWDVPHHLPQFTTNMPASAAAVATTKPNIIVDTTVRRPRPRTVYYDDIDDVTTMEDVMMTSSSSLRHHQHQHAKEHQQQQQKFYVIDQRSSHHHRHRRPVSTVAVGDDIKATVPFPL